MALFLRTQNGIFTNCLLTFRNMSFAICIGSGDTNVCHGIVREGFECEYKATRGIPEYKRNINQSELFPP